MSIGFNSIRASDYWCRCRKRNYAMSIKRLFNAVERRGDIGRRVAALVFPISNRPRVTSRCACKISLREPGEHTSGPNLASRDNVAHNQNLYTILETPPPVHPALSKAGPEIRYQMVHAGGARVAPNPRPLLHQSPGALSFRCGRRSSARYHPDPEQFRSPQRCGRADIGGDDERMFENIAWCAFGQRSSVIEHVDAIGKVRHHFEVMLDPDHGNSK